MNNLHLKKVVFLIAISFCNCSGKRQQELLMQHMKNPELANFPIKPELDIYLLLLNAKTNTTETFSGFESQFYEGTDSILNYFSLKLRQESIDTNHSEISKDKILEQIAADLKPIIASYGYLQGISIVWVNNSQSTNNVEVGMELSYQKSLDEISNDGKFSYEFIGDTIKFADFFYNGKQAFAGKVYQNKQVGFWEYWYSNGQKDREGHFENNEKVGEWRYWSITGEKKAGP